jgi:hypothetical protein
LKFELDPDQKLSMGSLYMYKTLCHKNGINNLFVVYTFSHLDQYKRFNN